MAGDVSGGERRVKGGVLLIFLLEGTLDCVPLVNFCKKGRQERGWVHSGGVSSRMLRIAKYPAATPWLCPVAPPCPLPAVRRKLSVPLGCAPSCFAEYQAILNILPKPPPECTHPLSWLLFVNATKQAQYGLVCLP